MSHKVRVKQFIYVSGISSTTYFKTKTKIKKKKNYKQGYESITETNKEG